MRDRVEGSFVDMSTKLTKGLVKLLSDLENNKRIIFNDFSIYVCYFKAVLAKLLGVDLNKTENISLCLFNESELNIALDSLYNDKNLSSILGDVLSYDLWYREYVYKFSLYVLVLTLDNLLVKDKR